MDFTLDESSQAVADLTAQILADQVDHQRSQQLEYGDDPRFDRDLWAALAQAGVLSVTLPEDNDGSGLGAIALGALLETAGRFVPPVPLLETVGMAAPTLVKYGSAEQRDAWLTPLGAGTTIVVAALQEDLADPEHPVTTAEKSRDDYVLNGTKICVPAGQIADGLIVSATFDGQPALFIVPVNSPGVDVEALVTTARWPDANVTLDSVSVPSTSRIGEDVDPQTLLSDALDFAIVSQCAYGVGVMGEALSLTSSYTKTRKQFDQPIASFQAVAHRAADAYIDTESITLTTRQAIWRIAEGLPARREVAVAKYFLADAGQRVVHAAQHLHGGIGVDRDYPLHRYFFAAKQLELYLGGTTESLARIGKLLAAS